MVAIATGVPSVSVPGQRGESLLNPRGAAGGIDFRLRHRLETLYLERGLDEGRGRDDRITGRKQIRHGLVAGDTHQ